MCKYTNVLRHFYIYKEFSTFFLYVSFSLNNQKKILHHFPTYLSFT